VIRSTDGLTFTTFATPFGSPAGINALASNGTSILVGGADASVAFALLDAPFSSPNTVKGVSSTTTLSSAWGDPASGHFYFITQTDETNPHWGLFRIDAGDTNATQLYALADASQNLTGISGRRLGRPHRRGRRGRHERRHRAPALVAGPAIPSREGTQAPATLGLLEPGRVRGDALRVEVARAADRGRVTHLLRDARDGEREVLLGL
jgi:hypothetical protein